MTSLGEWDARSDDSDDVDDPDSGGSLSTAPPLVYGSVDEFVREYLREVYRRKIDGRSAYWAAEWWRYDEAVCRLEALWRAWEHLRHDPATGMSVWWRDHADHHMAILMSEAGPFGHLEDTNDKDDRRLPYTPPPAELFPDVRPE
jgi:hypothetical protein